MKQFYLCAVIQIFRIHTNARNRPECKEQTQMQAFIRRSSSPSQAANPATVFSKAKCCRFKLQVLRRFYGRRIELLGRFSICVLVCTCVLVDLWNVISRRPSTVPIQSSHLAKYSSNPRMCPCSAPFIKDASEVTCANLRQPGIPECISHQSASVNGREGKTAKFQNISYCVMKCRSKSISGKNVVV